MRRGGWRVGISSDVIGLSSSPSRRWHLCYRARHWLGLPARHGAYDVSQRDLLAATDRAHRGDSDPDHPTPAELHCSHLPHSCGARWIVASAVRVML